MSSYDEWKLRTPEEDADQRRRLLRIKRDPDDFEPQTECPACGEIVPDDLEEHDGVCRECFRRRVVDGPEDNPADEKEREEDEEEDTPEEPTPIEPPKAVHLLDEFTHLFLDEGQSSGG